MLSNIFYIHNQLLYFAKLNIDNHLVIEENEPHEYYGATNGNLDIGGGPNQYWDQILLDSYEFLFTYLDMNK